MSGAGLPQVAAGIALFAVLVLAGCNLGLVYPTGLAEGAQRTSTGTIVALLLSGCVVYRRLGAFIPPASAACTLAAAGVGYGVARAMPGDSALAALLALMDGGMAYLLALVFFRESCADECSVEHSARK